MDIGNRTDFNAKKGFICDMDGDGAITSIDALLVFRKAMGIE